MPLPLPPRPLPSPSTTLAEYRKVNGKWERVTATVKVAPSAAPAPPAQHDAHLRARVAFFQANPHAWIKLAAQASTTDAKRSALALRGVTVPTGAILAPAFDAAIRAAKAQIVAASRTEEEREALRAAPLRAEIRAAQRTAQGYRAASEQAREGSAADTDRRGTDALARCLRAGERGEGALALAFAKVFRAMCARSPRLNFDARALARACGMTPAALEARSGEPLTSTEVEAIDAEQRRSR